jgi:hypothetical protein
MEAQHFVSKNDRLEKADGKTGLTWAQLSDGALVDLGNIIPQLTNRSR